MEKAMTLNAEQLELLRDFTNFPILQIFTEPSNASNQTLLEIAHEIKNEKPRKAKHKQCTVFP